MDKTIACVNFVNYSNITKEGDPDHKGATLPTTYDKNHRFDVSSISLKGDSEYIVNDRVVIKNIAHFVKLDVRTEDSTEFFTFIGGRPIDILRVFINGVSFRYEYPPSKICTLKPLDIIEIQFLDTNKRILYTNIIVIKSIKFIEE